MNNTKKKYYSMKTVHTEYFNRSFELVSVQIRTMDARRDCISDFICGCIRNKREKSRSTYF